MVCDRLSESRNDALEHYGKLYSGAIAQLGERLPCTQEVSGSIPLGSTTSSLKCNLRFKRKAMLALSVQS